MNTVSHLLVQPLINNISNENLYSNSLCEKITQESIKSLALFRKNRVLELGHGLCTHLPFLMQQAKELKYFGMEVLEEIVKEATKLNKNYVDENNALFQTYNGLNVPYVHNIFDRILSVNTLYVYKEPLEYFNELFRCLKPGGVCVVSFSDAVFLEQLKVLENKELYNFYDKEKLTSILELSDFTIFNIQQNNERVKTKNGSWADEDYFIVTLRKKPKSRYIRYK